MTGRNKLFILTLLLFCTTLPALAWRTTTYYIKDSLKYNVNDDGSHYAMVMAVDDSTRLPVTDDSTLVVPAMVVLEGVPYEVTSIDGYAFCGHAEIKHVIISEGVDCIGEYALTGCMNLESIHFPTTLSYIATGVLTNCPKLKSITVEYGNGSFDSRESCNALIQSWDDELAAGCQATYMPHGITGIDEYAFDGQHDIDTLVIPEGVKSIRAGAFYNCTGLKHIFLPESLERIEERAFAGCSSLQEIHIPSNVKEIGTSLFQGCTSLKRVTVSRHNRTFDSREDCNAIVKTKDDCLVAGCGNSTIAEGVKAIGEDAFYRTQLTTISIPSSVTSIDPTSFSRCKACTCINVSPDNPVYDSHGGCNAIIETATGTLVRGCGITTIPSGVSKIGDHAFNFMSMPANFVIPEGITAIGEHAFTGCDLRTIRLPSSLQETGMSAFSFCDNMESVDMSACREVYFGRFVFCYCNSLTSVRLPQKGIYAGSDLFDYTPYQEVFEREHGRR